jgi:hypothetical protein
MAEAPSNFKEYLGRSCHDRILDMPEATQRPFARVGPTHAWH